MENPSGADNGRRCKGENAMTETTVGAQGSIIAIKWLMYQHGMTVEEAAHLLVSDHHDATRQEAIDVAYFVTDALEV